MVDEAGFVVDELDGAQTEAGEVADDARLRERVGVSCADERDLFGQNGEDALGAVEQVRSAGLGVVESGSVRRSGGGAGAASAGPFTLGGASAVGVSVRHGLDGRVDL